jgi:hypothetical protein
MTDYNHDAAPADEHSLMSKFFDLALKMRETENTSSDGQASRQSTSPPNFRRNELIESVDHESSRRGASDLASIHRVVIEARD